MKRRSFMAAILVPLVPAFGADYIVKPGDTLSDILYENVPGRIYGNGNNLERLLHLNPQIKNPHLLEPNQVVRLPISSVEESAPEPKDKKTISIEEVAKVLNQGLEVKAYFSSMSLSATDATSGANERAISNIGYGALVEWKHLYTDKLQLSLNANFAKYQFNVSEGATLSESNVSKISVGIGAKYRKGKTSYTGAVGLEESLVLRSEGVSQLKVDKAKTPSLSVGAEHELYRFSSGYSINAFANGGLLLSANQNDYETKTGMFWNFGASSNLKSIGENFSIHFSYGQKHVDTDDAEQVNKDVKVGGGWGVSF